MAILLFGGERSSFNDAPTDTETKGSDLIRRAATPMQLQKVVWDESCPEAWRQELVEMARFERTIPAQADSSGRTIILHAKEGDRVKLKGAAGYISSESAAQVVLPSQNVPYANNQKRHMGVRPDLSMHLVESSPRYLHSLVGSNAAQEFLAHKRLSAIQASSRPLVYGLFNQLDASSRQTGFVATRLPVDSIELAKLTSIPYLGKGNTDAVVAPVGDTEPIDGEKLWQFHADVYSSIGSTRRRALEVAGIARHAGHHGNIYLRPDKQVEFFDLDSTVDFNALSQPERSSQMLRDLTADLVRSMFYISTTFYRADAARRLSDTQNNPLLNYLQGFFGSDADPAEIATAANVMTRTLQYELQTSRDMFGIHTQMLAALMQNDMRAFNGCKGNFLMCFYQLWPRVMAPLYALIQRSDIARPMQVQYKQQLTMQLVQQWQSVAEEFVDRARQEAIAGS